MPTTPRPPIDAALRELVRPVFADALDRLRGLVESGFELEKSNHTPRFVGGSGEYRRVERSGSDISYRSVFGHSGGLLNSRPIIIESLQGINDLFAHVLANPEIPQFLHWPTAQAVEEIDPGFGDRWIRGAIAGLPLGLVDRHIRCVGWDLSEEFFNAAYSELEYYWYKRNLPVEVVIPILAISFSADRIDLPGGAHIERMTDEFQLSRYPGFRLEAEQEALMPCATHALVFSGIMLTTTTANGQKFVSSDPSAAAPVERLFRALAIIEDQPSGFIQVAYRPIGWSEGWEGALPAVVHGQLERRYPPALRKGMEGPLTTLQAGDEARLVEIFGLLGGSPANVTLAARRLFNSSLREDEVDEIVDLCVGIEALVSDSSPGDTTFKLSMRTAAVLAQTEGEPLDPKDVFKCMKGVYGYRSALVHGSSSANKKRIVELGQIQVPATEAARIFLQRMLNFFAAANGLTATGVDEEYILGVLGRAVAADSGDSGLGDSGEPSS